ncbi:MAG TPA: tryptophan halogenase family protein [Rhodanobacteraceae bacterium]|nr:tryptophan halogenase family protein [Rhodanobacteraceae bacterium]
MTDLAIQRVVIVGGGTAGWMAAAGLARILGQQCAIRLVESEQIGTIGVGESTVPHLKLFNDLLGVDDVNFVKQTQGTFKLGTQFVNWGRIGDCYMHGFGTLGHDISLLPFHQFWLKARRLGFAEELGAYSLHTMAGPRGKFTPSVTNAPQNSPLADIAYAYHFDAGLYARFLRGYAERLGVRRTEGKVVDVRRRGEDGFVEAVVLESGENLEGDLFLDCSGFRGLLIEQTLRVGYEDWSHWLPCNSAVAVSCETAGPPTPYVRCTAHQAGWQWRIPLQNRIGNGYVYSNRHISDDEATATLLKHLDGRVIGEPRVLRFTAGQRRKPWDKNVVAMGLAAGFVEPLESTTIYMVQSAITRLTKLWPRRDCSEVLRDRYNAQAAFEIERIRDFIILHFCATERDDTPFWDYCRTMDIPEPLADNIRLFRDSGRFYRDAEELFALPSWVEVMIGQRILPRTWHPVVDQFSDADLKKLMEDVQRVIAACVEAMPAHQAFLDQHCKANA